MAEETCAQDFRTCLHNFDSTTPPIFGHRSIFFEPLSLKLRSRFLAFKDSHKVFMVVKFLVECNNSSALWGLNSFLKIIGGFGGLFLLGDSYLVAGADGVATKLKLAFETRLLETTGIDRVAMSVHDIVTAGTKPLLYLDYFATNHLDVDLAEKVRKGTVDGCQLSNCTLLEGETVEMPDCGVNHQLIELLIIGAPSPEKKLKLMKEIDEGHELDWDSVEMDSSFWTIEYDIMHLTLQKRDKVLVGMTFAPQLLDILPLNGVFWPFDRGRERKLVGTNCKSQHNADSMGAGKNQDDVDKAFYKELGTRCVDIEMLVMRFLPHKTLVVLLNKIDLVPREAVEKWLKYLREELLAFAFKCSTQQPRSSLGWKSSSKAAKPSILLQRRDCTGAETLIKLLKNYSRNHEIKKSIMVCIISLPNVGKSSLINSLKRCYLNARSSFRKGYQIAELPWGCNA
ncbi:hypothetical protein I3843_16G023700 [Carya illinoinensis]|uniref:PurM-like N-terminal domain-containing protein n=1 Tax=Carya illinoinensis TaxID=32201 RepID=A0A922D0T1_CARIL|nr:hypothetical protein I3842_16G020800 [Carya illinoinensis]KAG7941132.1 hypothetical protein I3843_16G023700 [Carya illinoinensis]